MDSEVHVKREQHVDVLIVGAGWHGLAMAKTYLEVDKVSGEMGHAKDEPVVVIVDDAESIGGTWASERLYPGLETNNIVGSYEFSDFPMNQSQYGLEPCQHIPGSAVHRYLVHFADHFHLTSRIRLRTKVDTATLLADGTWLMEISSGDKTEQLIASKLVLATGLTSEPSIPHFRGQDTFKGHIFHSKQLKSKSHHLTTSKTVVVIGGNKSAWDVSYSAAMPGATVHMIMRQKGGGPSWVWRPLRFGSWVDTSLSRLSLTRIFTWFDPSPFGSTGRTARWILHSTRLGRKLCMLFWEFLDRCICHANGYDDCSQTRMMKPWTSTFWMGNSLSIHNYDTDWFQLVKEGRIIPHVAEVVSLKDSAVILSDGTRVEADALVACTGWKSRPCIQFYPESIFKELALEEEYDATTKAQKDIFSQRPSLQCQPIRNLPVQVAKEDPEACTSTPEDTSSFRLYRFLVPASPLFWEKRNLAIIGGHLSIHAVMLAQVQALWITAFFRERIRHKPTKEIVYQTIVHSEYEKIRRPKEAGGAGARHADLVFDSLPYIDMLLEDLGIRSRRKTSWWKDIFQPYTLTDYRGLVREWLAIVHTPE